MESGSSPNTRLPPEERPFQFGVATLLVAVTLISAFCALLKWRTPVAFFVLFVGSSLGGAALARRFGVKEVFTSVLGGAFGAAVVMGISAFVFEISQLHGPDGPSGCLTNAWIALHVMGLLAGLGGGIVGLGYGTTAYLIDRVIGGGEEGASPFKPEE